MDQKDLLLIAIGPTRQTALAVEKILHAHGVATTLIDPFFIHPKEFDLFTQLLSTHRYVATITRDTIGTLVNHFMIQNSINAAQSLNFTIPDMWVQFGNKSDSLINSTPESMAQRILQEFFTTNLSH